MVLCKHTIHESIVLMSTLAYDPHIKTLSADISGSIEYFLEILFVPCIIFDEHSEYTKIEIMV